MKKWQAKLSFIFLIILAGFFYLDYANTYLETTYYEVKDEKIPQSFEGYKIAHLSDIHNTKNLRLRQQIIQKLKEEKPQMIAITGDLVDSRKTDIQASLDFIDEIKNIAPIYYVAGNHEHRLADLDFLLQGLQDRGVTILDTKLLPLKTPQGQDFLQIMGVFDPWFLNNQLSDEGDRVQEAVASTGWNPEIFTIFLSHRPELLSDYAEIGSELVLSGHAHGGQIRLPFIGALVAPGQGFFPKLTQGLHQEKNTRLVISRGIGNSILPYRINNQPELVIIHLHRQSLDN